MNHGLPASDPEPTAALDFNPFDPAAGQQLYALCRRLRDEDPVHRNRLGMWVITRHADAQRVLRDRRLGKGAFLTLVQSGYDDGPAARLFADFLFFMDPPRHTRIRRLVAGAFTPRALHELRPRVAAMADELVDTATARGTFDFMTDCAFRLPLLVIGDILGVPADDREPFEHWTRDLVASIDPLAPPEVHERGNHAAALFLEYFDQLIAERRRRPGTQLIDELIKAHDAGERLTDTELVATCAQLLVAGYDTTANLLGNGMHAFLTHPEQWHRLVEGPHLVVNAVEEILRYDTSGQVLGREALEEIELGGMTIPPGASVCVHLGAANRDPERYPDPDAFDITRQSIRPLSFGVGIHFCVGAELARMELQAMFAALARRAPTIRIEEPGVTWRQSATIRGPLSLPVTV